MDTGLRDQVVFITGASGGIGSATARLFAGEGARLVLHAHTNKKAVERLGDELSVDCLPLQADLTQEDQVTDVFRQALDHFGTIDVLVANAGIWPPEPAPIHEMSLERWNRVIAADQTSMFLCAREFFRHLKERQSQDGALVIVGSTAAVFGEEQHAEYAAAKAAVTYGLTLTLKNEIVRLAPRGRVNAVCPGWTLTRMTEEDLKNSKGVVQALQTSQRRIESNTQPAPDTGEALQTLQTSQRSIAGDL